MDGVLRQSTAVDVLIGPFVDTGDGWTAEEGLTPSVLLSKNGQALGAASDGDTAHDDAGYYNCELDADDTDTIGRLVLVVEGSSTHLPVRHAYQVIAQNVYDAIYGGSAALGTDIAAILADTNELQTDDTPGALSSIASAISTLDGKADSILEDTNELQTDDLPTAIAAVQTTADAIETDTQDIQDRLPAALTDGSIDANITHVIADPVTASSSKETSWGGTEA